MDLSGSSAQRTAGAKLRTLSVLHDVTGPLQAFMPAAANDCSQPEAEGIVSTSLSMSVRQDQLDANSRCLGAGRRICRFEMQIRDRAFTLGQKVCREAPRPSQDARVLLA